MLIWRPLAKASCVNVMLIWRPLAEASCVNVMLSAAKHLYLDTNSINRITSEVKMLRQAQHDVLVSFVLLALPPYPSCAGETR